MVDLIVWIIVGAIGGWLASFFVKVPMGGLLGNIIAGIIGGLVAGWLGGLLGINAGVSGINLVSIVTAFIGAIIVSVIAGYLLKGRT
jgi:uncharacterized membrane protein YeaQ/YmgE (transglycosylase-associated protein family)